jgi:hypothetical protein
MIQSVIYFKAPSWDVWQDWQKPWNTSGDISDRNTNGKIPLAIRSRKHWTANLPKSVQILYPWTFNLRPHQQLNAYNPRFSMRRYCEVPNDMQKPIKLAERAMLLNYIRKVRGSYLIRDSNYTNWHSSWYSLVPPTKFGIVLHIRPNPLPSSPFCTHYSIRTLSIVLSFI